MEGSIRCLKRDGADLRAMKEEKVGEFMAVGGREFLVVFFFTTF